MLFVVHIVGPLPSLVPQLSIERANGRAFAGFEEGDILFPPTYRFQQGWNRILRFPRCPICILLVGKDVQGASLVVLYVSAAGTDTYDERPDKPRAPAWCDRILWKSQTHSSAVKQLYYGRTEQVRAFCFVTPVPFPACVCACACFFC